MIIEQLRIDELNQKLRKEYNLKEEAENDFKRLQMNNAEHLLQFKIDLLNKERKKRLDLEQKIQERLLVLEDQHEKDKIKLLEKEEKKKLKKQGSGLTAEERAALIKRIDDEYKIRTDRIKKLEERRNATQQGKEVLNIVNQAYNEAGLTRLGGLLFGGKIRDRALAENGITLTRGEKTQLVLKEMTDVLAGFAKQLQSTVNNIASSQSAIDTRLQGSKNSQYMGSYWRQMNLDVTRYVGMSPLVKQADVVTNLKTLVGKGISFNVEQRAFLETIKNKIADTFEAADTSLVKLVRIQQEDTTAARLGMESALTSFLNNMYETTEYMSEMASSIRSNIYEASALMTAKSATEFEYQIQKWMGSLYSVGFSDTSKLSQALGDLAAGNISSISSGGIGNLLVMAANKANMSVADILANGLDASQTNELMTAMVTYLGEIYSETKNSRILAQQYAGVFGLTASDLKAAANLSSSISNISTNNLSNAGMLKQLTNMANSMYSRTSTGELMTNMFDNLKFATASSLANNPVLYAIYSVAGMLKDTVGGIDFSLPLVMGTGTAQTFNIADLMSAGALSAGLLSGIGKMLSGLGTGGGFWGEGMLKAFGVDSNNIITRGTGTGLLTTSGNSISDSGYTANTNSSDLSSKTMSDAIDSATQQVSAAAEESEEKTLTDVDESLIRIYELLQSVTDGTNSISVKMSAESPWL